MENTNDVASPLGGTRKTIEDLFAQRDKLKDDLKLRDKIFSLALHDIRSAMNGIFGFLDILAHDFSSLSDEEKGEYFSKMLVSSERVIGVMNEFSEWGELLSSSGTKKEQILTDDFIRDVIVSVNQYAQEKDISLVPKTERDLFLFADKFMLTAIVRNILMNAVKFTSRNGIIEVVSIRDKDSLLIQVADSGIGISEENLETIFSLRSGKSTEGTAGEKGTGLGLVLVKELVERMRGRISIQSAVGKGTTFTLSLPRLE